MNINEYENTLLDQSLTLYGFKKQTIDQKFNLKKKLEKIEKMTRDNLLLKNNLEKLLWRMETESYPLLMQFFQARHDNLELLESHLSESSFRKKEKEKIIELIIQGAIEIWHMGDQASAKYLRKYLNLDIEKEKNELSEDEEEENNFDWSQQSAGSETNRERQKAGDEKNLNEHDQRKDENLDLKVLYHKLVKILHPDKEMDDTKKAEKTSLMKKITEAYQNSDAHTLLKYVSEYLGLGEIEGRLELYLKELNQKIKRLKSEKLELTKWGPLARIYRNLYSRDPAKVELKIKAQLNNIRQQIRAEESCSSIYYDELYLRTFLREVCR